MVALSFQKAPWLFWALSISRLGQPKLFSFTALTMVIFIFLGVMALKTFVDLLKLHDPIGFVDEKFICNVTGVGHISLAFHFSKTDSVCQSIFVDPFVTQIQWMPFCVCCNCATIAGQCDAIFCISDVLQQSVFAE